MWHNYGFDRHILYNHGINIKGFGGDTMHMARLADPSRMRYSLKSLTTEMETPIFNMKKNIIQFMIDENNEKLVNINLKNENFKKN